MAIPFAFIPRIVSKHAKPWPGISRSSSSLSPPPDQTADSDSEPEGDEDDDSTTTPSSHDKIKGKERAAETVHSKQSTITQDIATLISLALSDHNIWLDADLRRKLDACLSDEIHSDEVGFVPINYILRRAPFRGSLPPSDGQPEPSETEVVKALRMHASSTLEVRMRLPSSASSSSVWYGTGKTSRKKDVGGYEVRRRDLHALRQRRSREWTRARWDDMTAYMEGIPPSYRTIGGVARFVGMLLSPSAEPGTDTELCIHVQCVTLPSHYLDKPGDIPRCKGYALVTFSTRSHVDVILRAWPWKRKRLLGAADEDEGSPAEKEAYKYGLRTISKARWDALNEEYLLYKQYLVKEMARTQSEMHHPGESATEPGHDQPSSIETQTEPQTSPQTTLTSPYPFGCLVFVRNVHSETNKTTLKSLFGQAFQGQDDSDRGRTPAGLDYVDFTKGMDTCYLRLSSAHHAIQLITYFASRQKAQVDGLDVTGRTPIGDDKPITMELIRGKKEELYWERVPEKIIRQAVDKAVAARRAAGADLSASLTMDAGRNGRTNPTEQLK